MEGFYYLVYDRICEHYWVWSHAFLLDRIEFLKEYDYDPDTFTIIDSAPYVYSSGLVGEADRLNAELEELLDNGAAI